MSEAKQSRRADLTGEVKTQPAQASAPVITEVKPARKFRVEFKDNLTLDVEAQSELEAWEKYQKTCGILQTVHKPVVSLLE